MDSMRHPSELPPELRERSFTLRTARSEDVSRGRLQHPNLFTPSRGIRVPWGVQQDFAAVVAPVLEASPDAAACWSTAARLWNLPLPPHLGSEQIIHLAISGSKRRPRRFGVAGHRLQLGEDEIRLLNGQAITSPARTWLDLAGSLTLEHLVALGDAIVCCHQRSFGPNTPALATPAELEAILHAHSGARGIRIARAALELIRIGADSVPETLLRLAAAEAGLPEPELNVVIISERGGEIAWPDLAYRKYRVAIQYDGGHHLSAEQQGSDARRDNETAKAGWISLRITKSQVNEKGYLGVMREVRGVLIQRGWHR